MAIQQRNCISRNDVGNKLIATTCAWCVTAGGKEKKKKSFYLEYGPLTKLLVFLLRGCFIFASEVGATRHKAEERRKTYPRDKLAQK